MKNLEITVCDPFNEKSCESQVYSNYSSLSLQTILNTLGERCIVPPELGNFPHVAGTDEPVLIKTIYPTKMEDNAGIDINTIIAGYLGSK